MSIFDPRNVAPNEASPLFNIPLRELLLLTHVTQAVSNNHGDCTSSGSVACLDFKSESDRVSRKMSIAVASSFFCASSHEGRGSVRTSFRFLSFLSTTIKHRLLSCCSPLTMEHSSFQ